MAPSVGIVILNYKGWKDTLACLESLGQLDYPNYRIIVVDNASPDGSEDRLREAHPDLTLLQSGANLGFAGGNNVGIRYALARQADYVWLLNNDTVVDKDALGALVDEARTDESIGMVGSKIYYYDEPATLWFSGGLVSPRSARTLHLGMNEIDEGQWDEAADTDYITGCSLLVKVEMIQAVGLMDEAFFLYYEEVDWAWRARQRGFRVRYCPSSKVWHKVSKSTGLNSPTALFHYARSSVLFARKHLADVSFGPLYPALRHFTLTKFLKGQFRLGIAGVKGTLSGLRHRLEEQK